MQSSNEFNQALPVSPMHLSDYIAVLNRRKWIMILFAISLIGSVSFVSLTAQPIYEASSKIIIEPPSSPMSGLGPQGFRREVDKQEFLQTQYHLLQSRELAERVIGQLDLNSDYLNLSVTNNASAVLGSLPSWVIGESQANQYPERKGTLVSPADSFIVDNYLDNLSISPINGSQLVTVSFFASSPIRAAQVADAHVRAFIDLSIEKKHAEAQQRLQWLQKELQRQKKLVEASMEAMNSYRKNNNIVSLDERRTEISHKISELYSALIKASSEVESSRAASEELQRLRLKSNRMLSLSEISNDDTVRSLYNRLVLLDIDKSEVASTYGPEHPKMMEIDNRIRQVEKSLDKEIQRLRQLVQSNINRALAIRAGLQKELDKAKQEALALQEKKSAYEVLQREAESNQKFNDVLLSQVKEIGILSAFDSNNVRIVEHAETPLSAARPRVILNIVIACVLGLFFGTGLSFFVEYMDNTVKSPEDVLRRLGTPVLGRIPYEKTLRRNDLPSLPESFVSPNNNKLHGYPVSYDEVALRLPAKFRFDNRGMAGQVLLVESAAIGEGKTTVLGNIAMNLGKAGYRVLVVDCDFQRPAVHHLFNIENKSGLLDVMATVLSEDIGVGSLEVWGIGDLFTLIALQKHSGRLAVTDQYGNMTKTVYFQRGRLLYIESSNNPVENRLGNMLVRSGFLTDHQLKDALEWNSRTGQPLGYILINAGYVKQDQLKGPLKLQMQENLQTLFSWKKGSFRMQYGEVETYGNERVYFAEDYTSLIKQLSRMAGRPLFENELVGKIVPTSQVNVNVLPSGTSEGNPQPRLNYMLLVDLLDLLKQRFDIILVDTPPVLYSAAAAPLHSLANGVVFVVKAGHLSVKSLNEAKGRLADYDAKIMGIVLNQVRNM